MLDIEAWSRVTGNILLREEVTIIRRMDLAYLKAVAKKGEEPQPDPRVSSRPAREVFDAIFG